MDISNLEYLIWQNSKFKLSKVYDIRAENFRIVDIELMLDPLFLIISRLMLQDYLKSVWKTVIIRETVAANQRKAGNQWENRNILIGENNLRISKEREKEWIND